MHAKIQDRSFIDDISAFSQTAWPRHFLRPYQAQVARSITQSVMKHAGDQFVVVFARQSGKDELLAQLSAYLMWRAQLRGGSIITVTPTYRPQGLIAMRRLYDRLSAFFLAYKPRTMGNTLALGKATCGFLSAYPHAQARGETATLMLVCNEAQDVLPARWDAVFDPMGASAHATQVFSGTVWTSKTLLARQMAYLGELERKDGKFCRMTNILGRWT
jgi:hypothetical protein